LELEIIEADERLSSKAADVLGFGAKDMASRDEGAATIILQSYLDSLE
jgi:RNase H-fold protein (predicted Holliday junction resolvase)